MIRSWLGVVMAGLLCSNSCPFNEASDAAAASRWADFLESLSRRVPFPDWMFKATLSPSCGGSLPMRPASSVGGSEAPDELDYAVEEMTKMLRFYESALAEWGVRLPYYGR
jgi:hypothetical protein